MVTTTLDRVTVGSLEELIEKLQAIRAAFPKEQLYVNEGLLRIRVIEDSLTDGSKVHSVLIR